MASSQNPVNSLRVETEETEATPQDQAVNLETNSTANTTHIPGSSQMGQNLANGPSRRRGGIMFVRTIVHPRSIKILLQFVPVESLYPARPTYHIPPAIRRTYSIADRLRLYSRLQAMRARRIQMAMNNSGASEAEGEGEARPGGQPAANRQGSQVQQSPNGNDQT